MAPACVCGPSTPTTSFPHDFVEDRTHDGRKVRMLNVVDEFTHKGLAIRVARKLKATDVIDVLSDLFILRGIPGHIRSDNGPEFVAQAVQDWIRAVGSKPATIEPGSPWENGYVESFNARLRDELLNGEILCSLRKAEVILERRRRHTNTVRPHASLGYSPPAPEVLIPALATPPAAPIQPAPPARLPVAPQPRPNQHPPRPLKGDCSPDDPTGFDSFNFGTASTSGGPEISAPEAAKSGIGPGAAGVVNVIRRLPGGRGPSRSRSPVAPQAVLSTCSLTARA